MNLYYNIIKSHAMIKTMDQTTTILAVSIAVLGIFVIAILILLIRLHNHYNNFLRYGNKGLLDVMEGIQKTLSSHESRNNKLQAELEDLKTKSLSFINKVVVKRFNPFSSTGGDQSFILGILDSNRNGVVITSLHSRENTRFYVKSIVGGEGDPHQLSDEEKKILKERTPHVK